MGAKIKPRPTIAQLFREELDEADRVMADLEAGIRSAVHYDELEQRVRQLTRGMIDAFRKGRV